MGGKAHPTVLKRLHGNPGKRPLNTEEPQPPRSAALYGVPPELEDDPIAIRYWMELVPMLKQIRQITDADRGVMVALCVQWSRYIEATQALQERDDRGRSRMLIRLDSGVFMPNPYIGIANKALALCTKLWGELGLTPSSRSRVRMSGPAAPEDPFTEFDAAPRGEDAPHDEFQ